MAQLSQSDMEGLLGFVRTSETFEDEDAFRRGVLPALRRLVPYDGAVYLESEAGKIRWTVHPEETGPHAEHKEAFMRLQDQHPVITHFARTGGGEAVKVSDFINRRQWHSLEFYEEFYRPLEIEYQITIRTATGRFKRVGIPLNRRDRDFTERDRTMMNLLRPHVMAAHRNVVTRMEMRQSIEALEHGSADGHRTVVQLDSGDRIRLETGRARDLIEAYFDGARGTGLPEELAGWMRSSRGRLNGNGFVPAPAEPLVVQGERGRLVVSLLPAVTADAGEALLIEEVREELSPEALRRLGLRPREVEVLQLVARGLSNKQIAAELVVSPRTVDTHLQRVYETLGVQTRTAAVAKARRGPDAERQQ